MQPNAAGLAADENESNDMKRNDRKLPARFEPDTRFEVWPVPAAPFRATQETELERLKSRLLRRELAVATTPEINAHLRRAANEAAALAWVTRVPLLVFPTLFEEKAHAAYDRLARQQVIRERSRELLAA